MCTRERRDAVERTPGLIQTSPLDVHTDLQTVITPLQDLGVLRQAVLSQPPGNGAIIHVWAAGKEEIQTAYLGHMLVHVFHCQCQRDRNRQELNKEL